jgi:tetratricopeptide (TPR) repeat protein
LITPEKRLAYALGYLALDLAAEARAELCHLAPGQLARPDALAVRLELAMTENDWATVLALAPDLIAHQSGLERPWIAWAYALRELGRIPEAQETLLTGARLIESPSPLVEYNLACYACLLGDPAEARRLLALAIARDPVWHALAQGDADLATLFPTP